jgi:hypothetical protein
MCKIITFYILIFKFLENRRVVRVIKSRRMRWARHVARMGDGSSVNGDLVGMPEGKREDLGVGGRITLRRTLGR